MPRKITRKGLIKKLDKLFSIYIRTRYAIDGMVRCVTCNTIKYTSEIDAGHFVSRRFHATRWSPLNVHCQCKKCNNWGSGESYLMGKYIDETYGVGTADELIKLSKQITKFTDQDLKDMIKLYEN